jgi:acyl dehydratase
MSDNWRIQAGNKSELQKIFTPAEVKAFGENIMDFNPIHFDAVYAAQTQFGKPIVHGIYVSGLISGILGSSLPGEGTIYMSQTLKFVRPVFVGEEVTAVVEVLTVREDKPIAKLKTTCYNASGETVVEGEALVKFRP